MKVLTASLSFSTVLILVPGTYVVNKTTSYVQPVPGLQSDLAYIHRAYRGTGVLGVLGEGSFHQENFLVERVNPHD